MSNLQPPPLAPPPLAPPPLAPPPLAPPAPPPLVGGSRGIGDDGLPLPPMNKGFYPLNAVCARKTGYWNGTTYKWEALGWKREIDCSFSRAAKPHIERKVPEPDVNGFSLFDEADCKRSQNCAIAGKRLVSMLSFSKSTGAAELFADLLEDVRDGGKDGDCPELLMDLFSHAFEVNGARDKRAEAMFRHLTKQDSTAVCANMTTHEFLLYQLRVEHETRDVKRQLQCLKNAHSILYSEAPVQLAEAKKIRCALDRTASPQVRNVVGAMREMAAYYLQGNNTRVAYVPDIFKFSISIQEKSDAFSKIFLTYYAIPGTDAEFEAFITDCCRIFGAAGNVDWAERDAARNKFKCDLQLTAETCAAFATDSDAWKGFEDNELQRMRGVLEDLDTLDSEAFLLMRDVAESLGVSRDKSGELLVVFESIFLSLSRSLKLVTEGREKLRALRQSEDMAREEPQLVPAQFSEQYYAWSFLCGYAKMFRCAFQGVIC